MNVSLIGFETYVGHHYLPKWTEFSITLMIVALGFALFGLAVRYLPIFHTETEHKIDLPELGNVRSGVLTHAGD